MIHAGRLLAAMVASIALVTAVMLLDEQREFESALETLRDEQQSLATALASDLESRLRTEYDRRAGFSHAELGQLVPRLVRGVRVLEQARSRMLLVAAPGVVELFRTDGQRVRSDVVRAAVMSGRPGASLDRTQAASLGLPPRVAVMAIRNMAMRDGRWSLVVVGSAERLRARERHAQWRFVLGLLVVTCLVAGFGGLALRDQQRKLQVARELEVAALERERERLLVRADKMATLAALSSGIAHQIATPLGTIVASVEQVLPAVRELPRATAALNVVAEQVARIQRIIGGVLDLARGNRPTLVNVQPETIVHSALGLVQHRLQAAGVVTALHVEDELPQLACDPPMLEQALVNLLLNACDASPPGATIHISAHAALGSLRIVVEDEGEGISDTTAARAKEPFFTTKQQGRGTGLGLAIAQEVVAHHGGKLSLARRGGTRGTRAEIELPSA